jgi:putative transposase
MALSESVVSELLDAFRAGEGINLIRDAVRLVLQELIELEATEEIGAARYKRTDTRVTERNGARPGCWPPRPAMSSCASPSCARAASSPPVMEAMTGHGYDGP